MYYQSAIIYALSVCVMGLRTCEFLYISNGDIMLLALVQLEAKYVSTANLGPKGWNIV